MLLNDTALVRLRKFFFELLQPARRESVTAWVEANVQISTGPLQGKASMKFSPYARSILEKFADKTVRHITMVFGTQAGKSSIMIWGLLYRLCRDAQDAMYVLPNGDLAKSFSKSRWQRYVRDCKQALALVPRTSKGAIDKHLFGFLEMHFLPMVLTFVGSNSPANLSSRPVGMLFADEIDKYGQQAKFEAAALELATERTKNFPFSLIVKASTPTADDRGVWQDFLMSDQSYYYVPCPRCSREILLKTSVNSEEHGRCGVRWWRDNEEEAMTSDGEWDYRLVAAQAYYKCQLCGGEIADFERQMMLENGIWRPSNPQAEPGRHGFQLGSINSVLSDKTSLSAIAVQFLTAKKYRKLQNFTNSWEALPWEEAMGYEIKEVETEDYDNSAISQDDSVPIAGIDCQYNHFWMVVRRYQKPDAEHPFGQSWILFADKVETEEELVQLQNEYGVAGENMMLDIANRPNEVGRLIIKNRWYGIAGTDKASFTWNMTGGRSIERLYSKVFWRDCHLGTAWQDRCLTKAPYIKFSKSGALDLVSSLRDMRPTIFHIHSQISDRYSRQIGGRVKRVEMHGRQRKVVWHSVHREVHLGDCESFCAVKATVLGLLVPPNEGATLEA
jgi:DNA-directed RNA polymerase subunit RPC12/RpoP